MSGQTPPTAPVALGRRQLRQSADSGWIDSRGKELLVRRIGLSLYVRRVRHPTLPSHVSRYSAIVITQSIADFLVQIGGGAKVRPGPGIGLQPVQSI